VYKKIDLQKSMLQEAMAQGISLTDYLEMLDPSSAYPGTELDAFERQLAARELTVKGPGKVVTLDAFYEEANRVLFPEFIDRNVRLGMVMGKNDVRVEDLIYTTSEIDSGTYMSAAVDMAKKPHLKKVGEGSKFPEIKIVMNNKTITLGKVGTVIKATYEYRRRVKADVFAKMLQYIGMTISQDKANLAIDTIIDGTGNNDVAAEVEYSEVNYNNLIDFFLGFSPFSCNILVGSTTMVGAILKLPEFKDPMIGFEFQKTGEFMNPIGSNMKTSSNSKLSTTKMLGIDNRFLLEQVIERGSTLTEADKLIDGQWDEIVISQVFGFAKTFNEAGKIWVPAS